jgi:parvulin-like peptidyl-prolyl isomerase
MSIIPPPLCTLLLARLVKQLAALTIVAGLSAVGVARAQLAPNSATSIPYQPRPASTPVAPQAASRPPGWVGGPATQQQPALNAEEAIRPWHIPKEGIPEKFNGTEVIARLPGEVILASDVLPGVEETVERAIASGQLPESKATTLRYHLMQQRLQQLIDTKMVFIEARREIPKENMAKIKQRVKEDYEKKQLPKLIDGEKIKSRAELLKVMREAGTSLEDQERQYFERSVAAQYVHKSVGEDKEITHQEMLSYYHEHVQEYETAPRVRWEHVMVRFSNYPSKDEAYTKIASWGNEIYGGAPFSGIASKHSDDLSSENGGQHDWTAKGSLASEPIDHAIFALPVGKLSPILEDDRGFHIVRVVERQELTRKPFGEVQAEIKKRIKGDRDGAALKKYLAELRKKIPVWTIFDDLPKPESSRQE